VPVRTLLLLAAVAIAGLLVYRQRTMDRWEQTLGLDRGSGGAGRG